MTDAGNDAVWMDLALAEARLAALANEVPVGCVLVDGTQGVLVSRAHNLREATQDPTAHAEILAIRSAAATLETWRLDALTAYVTLEPCPMCAGALVNARIARVVYGCDDPKAGALRSLYTLGSNTRLNHRYPVTSGVESEACAGLLRAFFVSLRARSR